LFKLKILREADACEKLTNINFMLSELELNSSTKHNYLTAVHTCKAIIKILKV